jgi:hypothetical protein
MSTGTQPPTPQQPVPVVVRRRPFKGVVATAAILAAVVVVLGVLLTAKSCGGSDNQAVAGAPAPRSAPETVARPTPPVPPAETEKAEPAAPLEEPVEEVVEEAPVEELPEVVALQKCMCDCRAGGKSVAACIDQCFECTDENGCEEPEQTARRPERRRSRTVEQHVESAPPAAPPAQQTTVAQSGSCVGPQAGIGPEPDGLQVNGQQISWSSDCYDTVVVFGPSGSNAPLVSIEAGSRQARIPADLPDAYRWFNLRDSASGRWALIHANSRIPGASVARETGGLYAGAHAVAYR